jgi:hypothetical protein
MPSSAPTIALTNQRGFGPFSFNLGEIMSADIFGELVLFTAICFTDTNNREKMKRFTLVSVPCHHSECEKVKADFLEKNNHMRARDVHAEFRYRECI